MKSYRREPWFAIPQRGAFVNITSQIEECLRESKIREGLVLVNTMQTKLIKFHSAWIVGYS